jgi:hypothetical protein
VESSARGIVRTSFPTLNDGRGNLTEIYKSLLSTNYAKYETVLELFRLCRNTSHNNGVYFPNKARDVRHILFKGYTYDFIDLQPVDLHDAPRLLLFDIVPDLLNIIEDIVNSPDVSKHAVIIDPSA